MSLETQISLMTVPQEFARLCNAVLRAEHGDDFLPIDDDQPDAGNDGYLKSQRRMYAMHCFKRAQNQSIEQLIRRKMVGDLGKAIALKQARVWDIGAWTFVSNYPVSEAIAAEVVRIGGDAEIDVSWRGPADLAAAAQEHPHVRDLFPTLQVNEVSDRLGALHERVAELAQEMDPSSEDFAGVPRTPDEQARLVASRPPSWEHLLFAGALVQGLDALEFAYLDFKMAMGDGQVEVDFSLALDIVGEVSDEAAAAAQALGRAFEPEVQTRAFGPSGEAGNVRAIQHLAQVVVNAYGDLLAAGNRLVAMQPPRLLARVRELLLQQMTSSIETLREFVARAADEIGRALDRVMREEPVELTLVLNLDFDPEVERALDDEWRRIQRKIRWKSWTGLNVDAR